MLVWIASYPRSGNHLLRMILQRCFDIGSYEIYQNAVGVMEPILADVVGVRRFDDETTDAFLERARSSTELFLVKTHDPVPDADACIYIVRDARAALVSYEKFQAAFAGQSCTLPDLISGKVWPGSWQDHVGLFLKRDPNNTLILHYEDLASEKPPLEQIGKFIGVEPLRRFDIKFSDLKARESRMFGTGHNRSGIQTVEHSHRELFWENCGEMMRALGYAEDDGGLASRSASPGLSVASSPPADPPVFQVVTPVFNGARYLDEAIESVVGQAGDFSIRYHIQDGGSSDDTIDIVRRWHARLESGDFSINCAGVHLTFESCPDSGMYDAIKRGFQSLEPAGKDYMTWINADDRLAPGAMAIVAGVFRDLPQVDLAGGRVELIDSSGKTTVSGFLTVYPRQTLAAGLHDGRSLPFIQQEGTFWRGALWALVGGIDTRFRLAGDWDLWRRFSGHADYWAIDAVTGVHRRHSGQLTNEMTAYYREIDLHMQVVPGNSGAIQREYLEWWRPERTTDDQFTAHLAQQNLAGRWLMVETPSFPAPARHRLLPYDGSWALISGVDHPEGPFPEMGIDSVCYWTIDKTAAVAVFSSIACRRRVSLALRGMVPGQKVDVRINGNHALGQPLLGIFPRPEVLSIEHNFDVGPCRIEIEVDRLLVTPEGRSLGVILSEVKFETASPRSGWLSNALRSALKPLLTLAQQRS